MADPESPLEAALDRAREAYDAPPMETPTVTLARADLRLILKHFDAPDSDD